MWILVIAREAEPAQEGAVSCLQQLGSRVRAADLWDSFADLHVEQGPPTAILVEALDEVDAGRAALLRLSKVPPLADVPVLLAVTVAGLSRLDATDAFDDFVLHPYVQAELYQRIRRAEWRRSDFAGQERIKMGALCVDLAAHEVTVEGRGVQLTHQEFSLLRFFAQHRGRVFTRQQLLERVWGVDYYGGSRTVDIHVRRLRQKLGRGAGAIETVRGAGYKMRAP